MAINRCRKLYRMPWRRRVDALDERAEPPSPGMGTEDVTLAELRADPVWQALCQLPEKLREAALHDIERLTRAGVIRNARHQSASAPSVLSIERMDACGRTMIRQQKGRPATYGGPRVQKCLSLLHPCA